MTDKTNAFPIYADRTVGPGDFRALDLGPHTMFVTSIFYTLQGEGPHSGRPAVFVRLAGCNRGGKGTAGGAGCQFCDTDFRFANGQRIECEEILRQAKALFDEAGAATGVKWSDTDEDDNDGIPRRLMVITGGEPMLQPNIEMLILSAIGERWDVQMESNGDLMRSNLAFSMRDDWMLVVSPKMNVPSDGSAPYYPDLRPDVTDRLDFIKVLVSADPTDPYYSLPEYLGDLPRETVYLSPITVYSRAPENVASLQHVDMAATQANMRRAAELCLTHGYRLSLQTHVWLGIA